MLVQCSDLLLWFQQLPWKEVTFSEWVQICITVLSLLITATVPIMIFWLQTRHEKQIEEIQLQQRNSELENRAHQFLIEHEREREYLPWCIFATKLHRHERHTRQIYTDFCGCSENLQSKILELAGFAADGISNDLEIKDILKWLDLLETDIESYQLGRNILYDGGKYFRRGFLRYRDEIWGESSQKCCFKAIKLSRIAAWICKDGLVDIGEYIDEYFLYYLRASEGTDLEELPTPPIDYVWDTQDMGGGTEKNMCMWVMELVINICVVIYNSNIHGLDLKENIKNYTDAVPETFEDAYYQGIQWLSYNYSKMEI